MFWLVDVLILALLALCVFMGYKRGLAKCAIKILSFIIAIVVAFIFFKPVSSLIIKNTEIDDNIKGAITKVLEDDVKENGEVKEDTNLPESMIAHINEEIKTNVYKTKEAVVTNVADQISTVAVNAIAWIGLFIATRILLLVLTLIFSFLTELPILKQIDKVGGIVYGVLQAAVIVFVIFAIISFVSPMIKDSSLISTINKSPIGSVLYNNNPIMKIAL